MMSKHLIKIVLDTTGGQRSGVGHLLRSIALAEHLRGLKAKVTMLTRPKNFSQLISVAMRNAGLDKASRDCWCPDVIVVDRPDTTLARLLWLKRQWPGTKIVVLDYYGPIPIELALVINLNRARERNSLNNVSALNSGLKFAILRPSFLCLRRKRRPIANRIRRIFVGFGGTDPNNWSFDVLSTLTSCISPDVAIDVLTGGDCPNEEKKRWSKWPAIRWHQSVTDPAPLLFASDLAIIGGGTMLMEAACLGVPAVVVPRTIDERLFARQFSRASAARLLRSDNAFPHTAIKRHISELYEDVDKRRKMQEAGKKLVDGRGTNRVAQLILRVSGK
jgi:spore coat polysaccharide biosynthesis predicted glycosyltransferase SpsG